ncbi:MAG: YkgJ family cysteine cluster protein [Candidatus Hodarchaeales archaeon]|jgi:Fe-S-cluster containining protein
MAEEDKDKAIENNTEQEISNQENKTEVKKKTPKYVFNCTKCGQCCKDRVSVPITIVDIDKWTKKGMITSILPHLSMNYVMIEDGKGQFVQLVMKNPTTEDGSQPQGCPMFDEENSICNIYMNMPLDCASFPLGYNGQSHFVRSIADKKCEGLGQGKMTKERLTADSKFSKETYEAMVSINTVFPLFYSLFMKDLMFQQEQMQKNLSEEDKAKIDEINKIMRDSKDTQSTSENGN